MVIKVNKKKFRKAHKNTQENVKCKYLKKKTEMKK